MSYWKNRKVIVTGGAGFIGSHLVEYLVEDGAKVRIADNLERGRLDNLDAVKDDFEFLNVDLRNPDACRDAMQGMEVAFNLAAKVTGIEYNRTHQSEMFESNMSLQSCPLRAAADKGVKRFIQISTACVYPHDAKVPTSEEEGDRGEPEPTNSGYGWAKRMGERLAHFYASETDMEICILRPFNAYGPRDYYDEKTSHVIPAVIKKVMDGDDPVEVWGSGNQKRVFVHARDLSMGMKLVAEGYDSRRSPQAVNIGHDDEISIRKLTEKIQEMTGIKNRIFYNTDMPEGYPRRAADTTLLKELTGGFEPKTTLEDGLSEMIEWYKGQK